MRVIAFLTLISLTSISLFWYTEVATPYQQEYTQEKATDLGERVVEQGSELGKKVLRNGEALLDDRERYLDKVKALGEKTLTVGEQWGQGAKDALEASTPYFDKARQVAGNLLQHARQELSE